MMKKMSNTMSTLRSMWEHLPAVVRNTRLLFPPVLALICAFWFGADFAFVRDLTDSFVYYFALDPARVGEFFGYLSLAAGVLLSYGFLCKKEAPARFGFVLLGSSFLVFSVGFALKALFAGGNMLVDNGFSALTPGVTYGLLGVWMVLTGTTTAKVVVERE